MNPTDPSNTTEPGRPSSDFIPGEPPLSGGHSVDDELTTMQDDAVPTSSSGVQDLQLSAFGNVLPPSHLPTYESEDLYFRWRRETRRGRLIFTCGAVVIVGSGGIALIFTLGNVPRRSTFITLITIVCLLIVFYSGVVLLRMHSADKARALEPPADGDIRPSKAPPRRQVDDVRSVNQQLIDRYHELTTQQAKNSYRNSQLAMAIGFLLLIIGAIGATAASEGTGQIVLGGLAGLGSAVSAYLGATFLRAYERALGQMNYYFGQPLVTSYILEAERLSKQMSKGRRDDTMAEIISETLRGASSAAQALRPVGTDEQTRRRRLGRSVVPSDAATKADGVNFASESE
ncbi:MAG: hypothetical protein LC808_25015 [Actinobacteria bacterium]|nr:hypothetical protein [Actinomycetota bacterium]